MAYTPIPDYVTNQLITAAHGNTYWKNNFAALFPYTTIGDVAYASASNLLSRLGIGTAGQVLAVNPGATAPEWKYSSGVIKRQGGSATIWSTPGTNNYTPTESKIQAGVIAITLTDDDESATITFPSAFTYAPIALCHISGGTGTVFIEPITTRIFALTNTTMIIEVKASGASNYTFYIHWIAIGI